MNLQALAAMDDCEHATGKPLHMHEVTIPHSRTAREIITDYVTLYSDVADNAGMVADEILKALRDGGYDILERVSVYKK
jgi:hypothetical protein